MDWAPPALLQVHDDAPPVFPIYVDRRFLEAFDRDMDHLMLEDNPPEPVQVQDPHPVQVPAPDTIMAPEPMPLAIIPPPMPPAPVTPPKKRTEPAMSQAKRAKGETGIPIKIKSMADGLDLAYDNLASRATLGTVVFLAGTKTWGDVGDDILILEGRVRETEKYRQTREWFNNLPWKPTQIVGHSLGAAVARALSEDTGIPCTTFNDPTPTWNRKQPGNFSSAMDPVSILNWGQSSTPSDSWNPHSYHYKASRRSFNLDPHEKDDIP